MQLPQELTTHTRTAKVLAIIAMLTLPFIGFFAGIKYQSMVNPPKMMEESLLVPTSESTQIRTNDATPSPELKDSVSWKTYTNSMFGYSFQYPSDWDIDSSRANGDKFEDKNYNGTVTLKKDGYEFTFTHNLNGVGGAPGYTVTSKQENITINSKQFLIANTIKAQDPQCFVQTLVVITPTVSPKCYTEVNNIDILEVSNNMPSVYLHLVPTDRLSISSINMRFPKALSVNDPELKYYNEIVTKIATSFKLI